MRAEISAAVFLLSAISAFATGSATPHGGTPIPAAASAVGYTINTLHSGPFTTSNVDTAETYVAGFQWYGYNLSGSTPPPTANIVLNSDGSLSIINGATLATSGSIAGAPFYHGNAYGCGAYFTAEISFNPATLPTGVGYPAWWSMAWENLVGYRNSPPSAQWTGQTTGYVNFIENDFFEWNRGKPYPNQAYGSTLHEWYGQYNVTCTGFCNSSSPFNQGTIIPPAYTDYTLWHRIAALWVPATGVANGYAQYYFDDIPLMSPALTWTQYNAGSDLPPPASPWLFGVMDIEHMILVLGGGGSGGAGVNMNVRSVDVWQGAGSCNISN